MNKASDNLNPEQHIEGINSERNSKTEELIDKVKELHECIFCDIVNKNANSWTVYQDKYISAFFDYYPASKWHILIVPNKHYPNIFETPDYILSKILSLWKKISKFYRSEFWITDINIIQSNWELAWQEVFHYHMHIVPRFKDDKVTLHWIPDENIRNEFDELKNFISKWIR